MDTKIIIILLFTGSFAFSQSERQVEDSKLSPAVKSFLIPGWGEKSLHQSKRSRFFIMSETSLWLSVMGTFIASEVEEQKYIAYAADHAGVDISGKDHSFWVDIGNYPNRNSFNNEHLRFRDNDALYALDTEWNWEWDEANHRTTFERMRIRGDILTKATSFLVAGVVLNHVISAIDAAYLQNIAQGVTLDVVPKIDIESKSSSLSFSIKF
ncbi:MAG: hypothetical protein HOD97_07830 [Candidatus Marinimicrobia bacterium]|jgi:hypothetical protein|nr:hypothetical protein [Candidatus Neomarinimicrobiota bacterium]MBT3618401.1 hypothetical protein [Candidatus Neomarinimicrobiota bacterium]MBT3829196.1 hypothetical protein [Candidatus Neomarinimicrobiota bacterium]MBT3998164.1 hypothetical protein [Candidatus Neomarinimicrobiota bacterium]MBT4281505.1 hypothetical protein [Candidatus Neomarinimicrobiota bacterium]